MKEQKFRRLEVWKKAMGYVGNIYKLTSNFPAFELYGLTSQLRRAATSIALNIAEGCGSGSDNEFKRLSLRSSYEVMCVIEIAKNLGYVASEEADGLNNKCEEISAMICGLKTKLTADS